MKSMLFFFVLKWWVWTHLLCNAQESTEMGYGVMLVRYASNELKRTSKQQAHPITPHIETTFIFYLKAEAKSFSSYADNEAFVDTFREEFENILVQSKIAFRFLYSYYHGFKGFVLAFHDPTDVLRVEAMSLDMLEAIVHDHALHGDASYMYGENSFFNPAVHRTPRRYMNLPEEDPLGGHDVVVAVLDQGIRYTEPPFIVPGQACARFGEAGCRVKKVLDFVDYYEQRCSSNYSTTLEVGYDGSKDVYGDHGTMMATYIGGTTELVQGVATQVTFYDYRVLNTKCMTSLSMVLLALDHAVHDDVDVISLSLNRVSTEKFTLDEPIHRNGRDIHVASAMGNLGHVKALFQVGLLASPSTVFAVGSFHSNIYDVYRIQLKWYDRTRTVSKMRMFFDALHQNAFDSLVLASTEHVVAIVNERQPFSTLHGPWTYGWEGKLLFLVLCHSARACVTLATPLQHDPRVLALIFVSDAPLTPSLFPGNSFPLGKAKTIHPNFYVHAEAMTHATAKILKDLLVIDDHPPIPSVVSSFGPTGGLVLKPDIAAIGCGILGYMGDTPRRFPFGVSHGTSNANAVVAGILALDVGFRQRAGLPIRHRDTLTRMQNTARPSLRRPDDASFPLRSHAPTFTVFQQGPGLVQVQAMLHTCVQIHPSKIELGSVRANDPDRQTHFIKLTLEHSGSEPIYFKVLHLPAGSVRYKIEKGEYIMLDVQMQIDVLTLDEPEALKDMVLLPAATPSFGTSTVLVSLQIPETTPLHTFLNGYLQFVPMHVTAFGEVILVSPRAPTPKYSPLSVPYLALYGDLHTHPALETHGERAAFLTTTQILECLDRINPHFPLQHSTSEMFPIYLASTTNVHYTFRGSDRPIVLLCILLPLKSLSLFLYSYMEHERLGLIRTSTQLAPECYLFFAQQTGVVPLYRSAGLRFTGESAGWNGLYRPQGDPETTRWRNLATGRYRICAQVEHRMDAQQGPAPRLEWCSVGFEVT